MAFKKAVLFRTTENEFNILQEFAEVTGRSNSDILREFVRSLEPKVKEYQAKEVDRIAS